jgi:hypothetical protein
MISIRATATLIILGLILNLAVAAHRVARAALIKTSS